MGHSLAMRFTQVSTFWTRESKDGGIQPVGLRRLRQRGARYLVCRKRRLRRTPLRVSSSLCTCCPRWVISAAHTTSPDDSYSTAIPVVCDPGSILRRSGVCRASGLASCRMITKGDLRSTAALPCLSNKRARAGRQGMSGLRWVSTTRTLDIFDSFRRPR